MKRILRLGCSMLARSAFRRRIRFARAGLAPRAPGAAVFAGALLLLAVGCGDDIGEEEILSERIAVAHKDWDGILLEFGSPGALPHLSEDGWSHGETAPDGNTFRWASENEASFTFTSDREGKHLAWIECEPFLYEGSPTQWIRLSVNGEEPAKLELRPGRERYPVELALRRGENHVAMHFRYAGDPDRSSGDRRRLAVALYRFDVPPEGEAPVAGRAGPFSLVEEGIVLPSGGAVRLFADVADARLRIVTDGDLEVTVRSEDRVLLGDVNDGDITANGPVEIVLRANDELIVRPELFVPADEPSVREPQAVDANIVLVFLDGANVLRFGPKTTPVLDALASESVVFETAVSQAVYTIASIGSVLTGQYPERHQSVSFADKLRDDALTFPGLLAEHGYRTAGFSGNAVASRTFGLDQGYLEFFQIWEQEDYTGHGDSVLRTFREWLAGVGEDRVFAYVHFREPHFPYNPPAPFNPPSELYPDGLRDKRIVDELNAAGTPSVEVLERVQALYEGNLAYVDDLVGQLVSLLDEDTILIVTADHGEALFEHGFLGHNTQLYEESIRVPLIMKIPGETPRVIADVVELIDLAPTILELAGVAPAPMEGRSLLDPVRSGGIAFSRTVWKRARYSARTDRFKLIWDSRTGERELYDLSADPKELENLADDQRFVADYLQQRLFAWLREQEHLRSGAPPPAEAVITERQREIIESIGYVVPK